MQAGRFRRYELRTSDLDAARAFYAEVLGSEFWGSDVSLIALPERAAARGAPPHWLGYIAVADVAARREAARHEQAAHEAAHSTAAAVEAAGKQLVAQGAQQLGPIQRSSDGVELAVLRDPFGAVLGLRSETPVSEIVSSEVARGSSVAWHQLHARDREQALAWYGALFGWTPRELVDVDLGGEPGVAPGRDLGGLQTFAWDEAEPIVGAISNGARLPHIHPQWLFFFRVADLQIAAAKARLHGGRILDVTQTARGELIAGGEDAQGAAFGLFQAARD